MPQQSTTLKQLFFLSEVSNLILCFLVRRIEQQKLSRLKNLTIRHFDNSSLLFSQILPGVASPYYLQPLLLAIKLNKPHVIKLTISVGFCLVFIISTFVFGDSSKSKVKVSTGAPKHSFFYEGNCIISFVTRILLISRNISLKFSRAEWMCLDDSCPSELGNDSNRLFVVCCEEILLKSGWWSQMKDSSGLDEFQSCCFQFSFRNHKMRFFWAARLIYLIVELLSSVAIRGVLGLQIGNSVFRELNCFFRSDSCMASLCNSERL